MRKYHYHNFRGWSDPSKKIEALIGNQIRLEGFESANRTLKLDVIEHLITLLRYNRGVVRNTMRFNEFLDSRFIVTDDKLIVRAQPSSDRLFHIKGTDAIHLQAGLLRFLLVYHDRYYAIHEIIEHFIESIIDSLHITDFEKTRTGVTRCFTTTRFAARSLRQFGLLRYTDKEAYKTWRLTLPGMMVAARIVEHENWHPVLITSQSPDLYRQILSTMQSIDEPTGFIRFLTRRCRDQKKVFESYEVLLKACRHHLMEYYRTLLDSKELVKREKQEKCRSLVQELEDLPVIKQFYQDFSLSQHTNELLQPVLNNH